MCVHFVHFAKFFEIQFRFQKKCHHIFDENQSFLFFKKKMHFLVCFGYTTQTRNEKQVFYFIRFGFLRQRGDKPVHGPSVFQVMINIVCSKRPFKEEKIQKKNHDKQLKEKVEWKRTLGRRITTNWSAVQNLSLEARGRTTHLVCQHKWRHRLVCVHWVYNAVHKITQCCSTK